MTAPRISSRLRGLKTVFTPSTPAVPVADCGAVVVCYRPPAGLAQRLAPIAGQATPIVVVDNGPVDGHAALAASLAGIPQLRLIANGANLGIARAMNQGLAALHAEGRRFGLILDHDSTPLPGMLTQLLGAAATSPGAAALVPRIHYDLPDIRCRWPVTPPGARLRFHFAFADRLEAPTTVDLAISSGMLVDLAAWAKLGGFREDLFIDLVDTEYCLRARAAGYRIVAVPAAGLRHALGSVQRRQLLGTPVYPTHHAPLRHYYLARNRVLLARAHARRFPSWLLYELASAAKLLVKSLLFESGAGQKLKATVLGTWDGLRGRAGSAQRAFAADGAP